jgi:hypothetical protein
MGPKKAMNHYAAQLAFNERLLADLASKHAAENDFDLAHRRGVCSAILSGAVRPGATILRPAPAMKNQSELDAEAHFAASKASADEMKAEMKAKVFAEAMAKAFALEMSKSSGSQ